MFTQQATALAQAFQLPPGPQQTQALLQVFANCIQGLRTNGPVNLSTGRYPPRSGVISYAPGLGNPVTKPSPTGDPIIDYINGGGDPGGGYPPGTWTYNAGDTYNNNVFGGPVSNIYGGDISYGDNYQTINNLNDLYSYNNYVTNTDNRVTNNNLTNWYQESFIDQSYTDLSTKLTLEQNFYDAVTNRFDGDTYFQNTVNQGDTINQGDTFNLSTVVNQGNVYNEGDTYQNAQNTYIVDDSVTLNLQTYVSNVVNTTINNIIQQQQGGGVKIATGATFVGEEQEVEIKVMEFDPATCQNSEVTKKGKITPKGKVELVFGNAAPN